MLMRAKMKVTEVIRFEGGHELLKFSAIGKSGEYPVDGSDEDNNFAKFTPTATLEMIVTNPELKCKFKPGMKFYLDFTEIYQEGV
jgi:hypothetical protein